MKSQDENFLLKVETLSLKRYGLSVLKDVSLEIAKADFVSLIGPNGAGKTSLLRCLMGLIRPSSGRVFRNPNVKIAYVPQRLHIENSLPMNVESFLHLRSNRKSRRYNNEQTLSPEFILEETELSSLLQRQLITLSFGQLQRVFLARALLQQPNLLILDEPMQSLDISGQLKFYKLITDLYEGQQKKAKKQNAMGLSIVMVSHELHMVMAVTRKVICLFHHICCSGTPKEIAKNADFQKIFGKDMAQFMKFYSHAHNHVHGSNEEAKSLK